MSDNRRIIYTRPDGGVSVMVPAPGISDEEFRKHIPADAVDVRETITEDIPSDRTFRNAWEQHGTEKRQCRPNLEKSRLICHDMRRAKREKEFAPLDEIIAKQIPGKDKTAAETARAAIRDKYAVMQVQIDAAANVETLKAIVVAEGL